MTATRAGAALDISPDLKPLRCASACRRRRLCVATDAPRCARLRRACDRRYSGYARQPDVFGPAKLGPVTLRNRIIKAATFEACSPDALVTDELIEFHRLPAAGGVGMTTVAYCAVSPGGRASGNQMWMRPEAVPGLRRLTDAIHAEGAAASAQIAHAGPVANASDNNAAALAPVAVLQSGRERVHQRGDPRRPRRSVGPTRHRRPACHRGRLRRRRNPSRATTTWRARSCHR